MDFFSQSWNLLQVVLGIGIVIFVHEAGHFLAARWCGVRVEVFSLGFGPRLVGWRRGTTQYQVALIPLGGYVRMAGEDSFADGRPPAPDDLQAKSVGQRFLIYSGGVIMNVVFALVIFPIIFSAGVPFDQPRIGEVQPASPAWFARLEPGTEVVRANGHRVISFLDVVTEAALSPEGVDLEVRDPGSAPDAPTHTVHLQPEYDEDGGRFGIGLVRPAIDPDLEIVVEPGSPAEEAGLRTGDRLVGVDGGLPEEPLWRRYLEAVQSGRPVALSVQRGDRTLDFRIDPRPRPAEDGLMLGIRPVIDVVKALRPDALLAQIGLAVGDHIVSAQGRPVASNRDLTRALVESREPLHLTVLRDGRTLELHGDPLGRQDAWRAAQDVALDFDPDRNAVVVMPGTAAEAAGLHDFDEILEIDGSRVRGWMGIRERTRASAEAGSTMSLLVQRRGPDGPELVHLEATPEPVPWVGASLQYARYLYRSPSFTAAVADGARSSWKFLTDAWMTLKRILRGQVSSEKNIGGIITIGVVSYSSATVGFTYLLFFLCMLSVNLAFINILPIPLLDGGHLFFLIVEKIKGSPVSERVLGYSQMVGLVMIVSLMIYVTFNDLRRWFLPG